MSKRNHGDHMNKSKYGSKEGMAIFFCVIAGICMFVTMFVIGGDKKEYNSSESSDYDLIELNPSEELLSSELSKTDDVQSGLPYDIVEVDTESLYKGDLILVNRENLYTFKDETKVVNVYNLKNEKYKLGSGNEKLFEKTIVAANDFLGDFYDVSGKTNVTLVNGYFTYDEQQKKYENYIKNSTPEDAQKWGVVAGASDHHTALSFNLTLFPTGGKIGTGDYAWLTENAYRYGFILRYPSDKNEITSVKDENHFRYVGYPHAEYIYKNNLTLEEYISMLEKTNYNSPLSFTSGNKDFFIYFSPADMSSSKTEIKVPQGYSYSCSGDNVSGFIITATLPE